MVEKLLCLRGAYLKYLLTVPHSRLCLGVVTVVTEYGSSLLMFLWTSCFSRWAELQPVLSLLSLRPHLLSKASVKLLPSLPPHPPVPRHPAISS